MPPPTLFSTAGWKCTYPATAGYRLILREATITGRPILLTSASIVGGLLILALASFVPIVYFGILISLTLFATAVGSLVVLPVILSLALRWSRRRAAAANAASSDGGD